MNRKSISASFNAEEIEGIDRVCEKLGITRGQLLKDAVTFWLIEKPLDDLRHNHPEAYEAILEMRKKQILTIADGELFWFMSGNETGDNIMEILSKFHEEHDAYHKLAKKKKKGRPKT